MSSFGNSNNNVFHEVLDILLLVSQREG